MDALIESVTLQEKVESELLNRKNRLYNDILNAIKDVGNDADHKVHMIEQDLKKVVSDLMGREKTLVARVNTASETLLLKVQANAEAVEQLTRQNQMLAKALRAQTSELTLHKQREMAESILALKRSNELLDKKYNTVLGEIQASQEQIRNVFVTFQKIQNQFETITYTIKSIEAGLVERQEYKTSVVTNEKSLEKVVGHTHAPSCDSELPYKLFEASFVERKRLEVGAALHELNSLQKLFSRRKQKNTKN